MPWGGLALAIVLAYVVQASLAWLFGPTSFDPFLLLTLCVALFRTNHDARMSGWVIGLAQDLGSADPLDVHAFVLGLTAVFVTQLRQVLNANLWWSRGAILLAAAFPAQLIQVLFLRVRLGWEDSLVSLTWQAFVLSMVATLLAGAFLALPWVAVWRRRSLRAEGVY